MNKFIGMGRLTADVNLKYSSKDTSMAIARYTLAIDTGFGEKKRTDFIRCVAFGKAGEFAAKYLVKGLRVLVSGSIKTGSYKNKDEVEIPTTDIIIETQEFADVKKDKAPETDSTENFEPMEDTDDALPFV